MKRSKRVEDAISRGLIEDAPNGLFQLTYKGRDVINAMREEELRRMEELNAMLMQEATEQHIAYQQATLDDQLMNYLATADSPSAYLN
jgi:hypothetical protein